MMSKSVFFIDDDENYLHFLERVSEDVPEVDGFFSAKNGKEALEKLTVWRETGEELPSVMFIDVAMPVMDGFEFLDEFKLERDTFEELRKIIPIIVLTSSMHEVDKQRAMATGIVEKYVVKPSGIEDTAAMLREAVQ